ncbi:NB-ARC domain-containing protein [soil metagenome]
MLLSHKLQLRLFGAFELQLDGVVIQQFEANTARGLLAYLAIEGDQPHPRVALAALLWGVDSDAPGLTNLRSCLRRLRNALGGEAKAAAFLQNVQGGLQLATQADGWVDVHAFETLLAQVKAHPHSDLYQCPACIERITAATHLYHGPFLADLVIDSLSFEEWQRLQQERLHRLAMQIYDWLVDYHYQAQAYGAAEHYARRQLALEPWREEAHQQLMRSLFLSGQRTSALRQYELCRQLLATELGVAPTAETVALYEQIKITMLPGQRNTVLDQAPLLAPMADRRVPYHDLDGALEVNRLYGRQTELDRLTDWLTGESCRLVAILGMGGMGKTTLAAQLVHNLRKLASASSAYTMRSERENQLLPHTFVPAQSDARPFEVMIWRSLLNAPPLVDILRDWLLVLSDQQLIGLPERLDDQLGLLFTYLRQRRCLFVLDNLESLFESGGRAGQFRPGYAGYGQLIQCMGEQQHQSTLLLTSREQPQPLALMEQDHPAVRSLHLSGLAPAAGLALLHPLAFAGSAQDRLQLIARYSGNPLALKVVAQTIDLFFGGDLQAFMHEDTLIFESMRDVLDQQFTRLSPLEIDVLFWLAIEREPVSLPTLRADLMEADAPGALLDALRALEQRSLLEHTKLGQGVHFLLQNVIMEYLLDRLVTQICREIEAERFDVLMSHALLKAQTKEYVRQSQARLILAPIAARLTKRLGRPALEVKCKRILMRLQAEAPLMPGYAGGNLLNLLLYLNVDLRGYDFSGLSLQQVYAQGLSLAEVKLTNAQLSNCVFTATFGMIHSVAFSPDGQLLAAGTDRGEICLWRTTDSQPYALFQGHAHGVWSAAFSPDGQWLISGGGDALVRLWMVADLGKSAEPQARYTLHGHTDHVRAVVVSPDGRLIASGSADQTICLWDFAVVMATNRATAAMQPPRVLRGHQDRIFSLAFNATGTRLASAGVDQVIRIWAVVTGECRQRLVGHHERIAALAFHPSGELLASASVDRTARLWNIHTGECRQTLTHPDIVLDLVFSLDGVTLATGSHDGTIRLYDVHTGQPYRTLQGHGRGVWALAFSPDGRLLASGGIDHQVRLWELRSAQCQQVLNGAMKGNYSVAFSPDGLTLASGGEDGKIYLWDLQTPGHSRCRHVLSGHTQEISTLVFSPTGDFLVSGSHDHTLRVWALTDLAAKAPDCQVILGGHKHWVMALAFSPDGTWLASGGHDGMVCIWAFRELGQLALDRPWHILYEQGAGVYGLAFSPDSRRLAATGDDANVRVWQLDHLAYHQLSFTTESRLHALAFSLDGGLLAGASLDASVRLWDAHTGHCIQRYQGHTQVIESVAFSPDGLFLASGSMDQTIRIWSIQDLNQPHCHYVLLGHQGAVRSVAFHPSGELLASSSIDGTTKLWSMATGECVETLSIPGPYEGMEITGVMGITAAQLTVLKALGAIEQLMVNHSASTIIPHPFHNRRHALTDADTERNQAIG